VSPDVATPVAAEPAEATETPVEGGSPEPKPKGLLHALGVGLSFGLLAFVMLIAVLVIVVPAVTGGRALTVLTSSMVPNYPPGTLVVVTPTDPQDIAIGDVLTYQLHSGEPTLVTHRVVAITNLTDGTRTFTTKGDNNDLPDADPVMEVQVVGTVLYAVPYLGWANTAVNGDLRGLIVPVIVGALFAYAVWMLISSLRDKRRSARERTPSDPST